MTPELWHLLFAAAGAALGWWLKHQGVGQPADPALAAATAALAGLHQDAKARQGHALLRQLLAGAAPPAVPAP